ncbi:MAG TPA: hypothetical protein PLN21_09365 [Gemmatales bacterium]|nr:hypothetical protein [Gemmatales bacterium]
MLYPSKDDLIFVLSKGSEAEKAEITRLLEGWQPPVWVPFPGPQTMAYNSKADELFFGGGGGGGKSDLLLGLGITKHRRTLILRREQTQLTELVQRSKEIIEGLGGFNGTTKIWSNLPGDRRIEFGGCEHDDDKQKYKGRPHDLKGFDEGTDFLESQYDFIGAWCRTAFVGQKCTRMLTGNPPQTAEGEWVLRRWAPWIDPTYHGTKAKPGELRWFARVDGKEVEVEDNKPIIHKGREIRPWSRTFVPALVDDNPVYMATGYDAVLDALPEPLRSMLRSGDFGIGRKDDEWQVIPTAWVQAAMKRWAPDGRETYLDAIGLDVARGGKDKTILAKRYGSWIGELSRHPGKDTPDGQHILRLLQEALDDEDDVHHAITHIDSTGVGSSPTDLAIMQGIRVNPVIFGAGTHARDRSGRMKFRNQRAWLWWNLRDMLDPDKGDDLALPPDQELLSDLTSARWKYTASGILLEEKEETIKRIGRSPDAGEAVVLACYPGGDAKIETDSYHKPARRAGLGR